MPRPRTPNLTVDIGDFIDTKLDSLRCHVSLIGEDPPR
jgi:LmbE family N-acetylglucosaminyl deacetylase